MQTTKPNIPTKNKNSADPDIRKFRDSEVNAIVAGFQQVDDNFDVVETELVNIAEPDLYQFFEGEDGRYKLGSKFLKPTNFPTVTFEASKIHGSITSPQYNFLNVSKAAPKDLNNVVVKHCSLVFPSILVPNKPVSPLPTYNGLSNPASLLGTYANQAAMTADFANQVADSYYYFTGNNGAWKYNGTATDSINNYARELYMLGDQSAQVTNEYYYYTGSTSAWQKTATSTGVIGNYTELAAILGWEEWGTKPSWLIVQGDAYLVGEDNLNTLSFVYHELIKISGVSYADVVVVTNSSHTGMNADLNPPNFSQILNLDFNTNVNNSSYWGVFSQAVPELEFAANLAFIDLGGGKGSLRTNTSNNSSGGVVVIPITDKVGRYIQNSEEFFFVCKVRRIDPASTTEWTIFCIQDSIGSTFRCRLDTVLNRMRLTIDGATRTTPDNFFTVESANWVYLAFTYSQPVVANNVKFYAKGPDYTTPFTTILSNQSQGDFRAIARAGMSHLNFNTTGGGTDKVNNLEYDGAVFGIGIPTQAEIEAIWDSFD